MKIWNDLVLPVLGIVAAVVGLLALIHLFIFCGNYFPWLDYKIHKVFEVPK